jgi:3-oxoacyl-[acyl-carrier-protein] synthase-3
MRKIAILGSGSYFPGEPIDSDELMKLANISFDKEKIENLIGIKKRHIAKLRKIDETTADFAHKASLNAIKSSNIKTEEIDLIIVATDTPEYISPATSIVLQGRLQGYQSNTMVFDISASCASFVTAFDTAARMMISNQSIRNALVVGVYNMTRYVRDEDAFGWSIFADGAGAIILGDSKNISSNNRDDSNISDYIDGEFISDGTQWNFIGVYAGGTRKIITKDILDSKSYGLELIQRLPPDRNIKLWPPLVQSLCQKVSLKLDEIDYFIFTQINKSVIIEVMKILNQPIEKAIMVMDKYGYTGSACVPTAFDEAVKERKIKRGDKILFCASGAGLAVGANIFVY